MSRRTNVTNGIEKEIAKEPRTTAAIWHAELHADTSTAVDKQKRLLESPNPGHFSMVRALHLADLITLLNGAESCMAITIYSD